MFLKILIFKILSLLKALPRNLIKKSWTDFMAPHSYSQSEEQMLDIFHFATYLFYDKKCEMIMNLTFDPTTEW